MRVEIFGGGFTNKGAELMLKTCVKRLRRTVSGIEFAVEPIPGDSDADRESLGLSCVFPSPFAFPKASRRFIFRSPILRSALFATAGNLSSEKRNRRLGQVKRSNCDALLDISGYAFGDSFHHSKTRYAADRSRLYASSGKPVIYLPQMFGPFTNDRIRSDFKSVCDHATLIYARDKVSYKEVEAFMGKDERLRQAPDVTIFEPPKELGATQQSELKGLGDRFALLVPNEKMISKGGDWTGIYLDRMVRAGIAMVENGVTPVVTVHASDPGDSRLAAEIHRKIESNCGTGCAHRLTETDPSMLKAIISHGLFLVGSRFHSIVAACSTCVPAVSLGWAAKYVCLAEDFGIPDLLVKPTDDPLAIDNLVRELTDRDGNAKRRQDIGRSMQSMRSSADEMWESVESVLRSI